MPKMVSGTCALMQIFLCRRHVQLLPFVKGFNGQRDLLKWNNLHRWQQSLELVACHCTATLLLVSVTALVRHAVGAEEDLGIAFSGHFFFLHTFARCIFTCCTSKTCMVRWLTAGKDARAVCVFEDKQSIGQSIFQSKRCTRPIIPTNLHYFCTHTFCEDLDPLCQVQ